MPRTTLSAVQAELLDFSETLLVAADLLNDNTDDLDDLPELISVEDLDNDNFTIAGEDSDSFDDYISEILEMQAQIKT
ncbi:hypothetical protein JOM56_000712 [Amanita muscaria]